jgi:hypothetical protein
VGGVGREVQRAAVEVDGELVAGRGVGPARLDAHERATGLGKRVATESGRGLHHGFDQRCRVEDGQQLVDVDVLLGESAAHHVVARAHQFDTGSAEVGVQVAGGEVECLARLQRDPVEQQRHHDARVVGVLGSEPGDQLGLGPLAAGAGDDGGSRVDPAPVQALDHRADAVGADRCGERLGSERAEQDERRGDRADPAQRIETRECAQQLGLGPVVGIDASGVTVDGLRGGRVHLERQGAGGSEDLEQIAEFARRLDERPALVDRGRAVRVRAQPQFGPRTAIGGRVQQLWDERLVTPCVVLDHSGDRDRRSGHRRSQSPSSAARASTPSRSAPIVVESPWPVWTMVWSGSASRVSRIDRRIVGSSL